jgi:hemerythrin-like domain-containing protein
VKITDALRAEHRVFLNVFKQIEDVLPSLVSPLEIQTMARVVESILRDHAHRETHLVYLVFDKSREENGEVSKMHEEHREIDTRLIRVNRAGTCAEARRLLKAAIISSREHFAMEEKGVFPLIESTLAPECLEELGAAWSRGEVPKSVSVEPPERATTAAA